MRMKWTTLFVLLIMAALTGCNSGLQETRTGWIEQRTPYPVTLVEYIDGDAETGVDLGAALAANFTAEYIKITRTAPSGIVLEIEAKEIGTNRSELMAELPDILKAFAAQIAEVRGLVEPLAELAGKLIVPVPEINIGGDDQ